MCVCSKNVVQINVSHTKEMVDVEIRVTYKDERDYHYILEELKSIDIMNAKRNMNTAFANIC
jgi:hypothetical protein